MSSTFRLYTTLTQEYVPDFDAYNSFFQCHDFRQAALQHYSLEHFKCAVTHIVKIEMYSKEIFPALISYFQ